MTELKEQLLALRGRLRREPAAASPALIAPLEGLFVRGLSAAERDDFEQSRVRFRHLPGGQVRQDLVLTNLRARLLVLCLVDSAGKQVFEEGEAAMLGELPAEVLDPWYDQACRLSGMGQAQEDAEKNSRNGHADASPFG